MPGMSRLGGGLLPGGPTPEGSSAPMPAPSGPPMAPPRPKGKSKGGKKGGKGKFGKGM